MRVAVGLSASLAVLFSFLGAVSSAPGGSSAMPYSHAIYSQAPQDHVGVDFCLKFQPDVVTES
ncbi:hypothetical protein HUJ04_005633 [Dendroctonus ponderosae]|nr:hypothetical protein HUJ04_005633 [Dendroctonus ponderosae]